MSWVCLWCAASASSGSRDRRWATVSGSAGSGAAKSGLATSRHSVMAQERSVLEDVVGQGCCASMLHLLVLCYIVNVIGAVQYIHHQAKSGC